LLFNAADALGGQGEIRLRAERYQALPADLVLAPAPAPQYVAIHVQDAGQGIAPEILPRIFEPFFTTKALSTRHGTGLGLTMVYEIAKELGFGLQVESAVGQGTVFTLLLPVPP
jgi:signal transduction histidine kinase